MEKYPHGTRFTAFSDQPARQPRAVDGRCARPPTQTHRLDRPSTAKRLTEVAQIPQLPRSRGPEAPSIEAQKRASNRFLTRPSTAARSPGTAARMSHSHRLVASLPHDLRAGTAFPLPVRKLVTETIPPVRPPPGNFRRNFRRPQPLLLRVKKSLRSFRRKRRYAARLYVFSNSVISAMADAASLLPP